MRAFRVGSAADIRAAEAFRTEFHLFDAYRHGIHGGTGHSFDWELLAGRRSKVAMVLAGGLTPENVGDAIRQVGPWGVDVATGVEARPGHKDPVKLRTFISAARDATPRASAVSPRAPYDWREEA